MKVLLLLLDTALVLVVLFILLTLILALLRAKRSAQLTKLGELLAERGWAGYRLKLDHAKGKIEVRYPVSRPEEIRLALSTRHDGTHDPEMTFFDFGNDLDRLLPVRAGSAEAIENLRHNLGRVSLIGPLIRAYGGRLAFDVGSDATTIYFARSLFVRGLPMLAVRELLPAVLATLDEVLPAAWYPGVEGELMRGEGPFRGEGGGSAEADWMVESKVAKLPADGEPPPLEGPLSLDELAARLRAGRLSWFSRAARPGAPLQPLTAIEGLRPLRDGPVARRPRPAPDPVDQPPPAGAGKALMRFLDTPVFFGIALLAFCVPALSVHCTASMVDRGQASAAWPAAKGEITTSRVAKRAHRGKRYYRTKIFYRYEVDGKRYEGDRLRFVADARQDLVDKSEAFSVRGDAEYFTHRFPPGKRVPVYYDPQDPKVAVLIKGEVRGQHASIIFGASMSAIGALYLLLCILFPMRIRVRSKRRFAARLAAPH